jgi:hypothetical protein
MPEKTPELRDPLPGFLHSVMVALVCLRGVLSERDFPSETTDFLFTEVNARSCDGIFVREGRKLVE